MGYVRIIYNSWRLSWDYYIWFMSAFAETIIKIFNIEKIHPYTIMQMFGVILLICSWASLVLLGLLVFDYYFNYRKLQK